MTDELNGAVRLGMVGMGGYAAAVTDRILNDPSSARDGMHLVAACDRAPETLPERLEKLAAAKVEIAESFDAMLADPRIEAVWLPLPIQLHRDYTERALAAGKHVICEKPAAGSVQDVDAMIAARDRSGLQCLIGFQDLYQPAVHELKRRLLSGQLGAPRHASVLGCWPRSTAYFGRSNWAGKMRVDDTWVLDSPANNAMAHPIHLALFLLGDSEHQSASPVSVEVELYRANRIENYDTCTIRAILPNSVDLLVAMTHACEVTIHPTIIITTDRTTIQVSHQADIVYGEGDDRVVLPLHRGDPWHVPRAIARRLRSESADPVATLEMARAHTLLINAASQTTPVLPIPNDFIDEKEDGTRIVKNFESVLGTCIERRRLLHESRQVDWSSPPGRMELGNYTHFTGPRETAG